MADRAAGVLLGLVGAAVVSLVTAVGISRLFRLPLFECVLGWGPVLFVTRLRGTPFTFRLVPTVSYVKQAEPVSEGAPPPDALNVLNPTEQAIGFLSGPLTVYAFGLLMLLAGPHPLARNAAALLLFNGVSKALPLPLTPGYRALFAYFPSLDYFRVRRTFNLITALPLLAVCFSEYIFAAALIVWSDLADECIAWLTFSHAA